MNQHWTYNLPDELSRRMRNKYHKWRGIQQGLPSADYVCLPPDVPAGNETDQSLVGCLESIINDLPVLSDILKINIGEDADDLCGDTMLKGLNKVNDNLENISTILTEINTYVNNTGASDKLARPYNWIEVPNEDMPIGTTVGSVIASGDSGYLLSRASGHDTIDQVENHLNTVGVVSEVGTTTTTIITSGQISGQSISIDTHYLAGTDGEFTTAEFNEKYTKPIIYGVANSVAVLKIHTGEFKLKDETTFTDIYPGCTSALDIYNNL